ncbi:MAG: cell division protein FtsQ/DivIB [Gammaproteobacteria bacterium]
MKQPVRHPRNSGRRRVWYAAGGTGVALALIVVLALVYARPLLAGPALTQLVITGRLEHVSPQAVRAAVRSGLGTGFFATDVGAIRRAVAALPWVDTVSVRRSWPHTLYIDIAEETPAARWNATSLVDAQGRVFAPGAGQDWTQLPALSGPEGSAAAVLAEYRTYTALLAPKGLVIRQITVDARGAASVGLSDGISVRLGRQQAEVRLERFASVALPVIKDGVSNVAYVDMRYTNGFAVGYGPTCQWQVGADGERRATDGAAGQPTMDGSQGCEPRCAASSGGTPATANARQGSRAGEATVDGSQNCGASCVAAGQRTTDASQECSAPCATANPQTGAGLSTTGGSQDCAAPCAAAGAPTTCTTANDVQTHNEKVSSSGNEAQLNG